MNGEAAPLRVLIVDDSPYNRRILTSLLEKMPGVEVVGRARDGREALQMCTQIVPDLVTLDLEMPEMDGFTFLRLLMSRQPTPVLVVSGYSARENVFRALELGALDFIPTPSDSLAPDLRQISTDLVEKINLVKRLRQVGITANVGPLRRPAGAAHSHRRREKTRVELEAVFAIASSTGGPPALQTLLSNLRGDLPVAILIAQHMPANFTSTFATRLDRLIDYRVQEGANQMAIEAGNVYIAPGGRHMSVIEAPDGQPVLSVTAANDVSLATPHICPSADHLFRSCAEVFRHRVCGVVLTGMGSDGTVGSQLVKEHGGVVYCEDPESAVMPGMPRSAVNSGVVDGIRELDRLHELLESFVDTVCATLRVGTH